MSASLKEQTSKESKIDYIFIYSYLKGYSLHMVAMLVCSLIIFINTDTDNLDLESILYLLYINSMGASLLVSIIIYPILCLTLRGRGRNTNIFLFFGEIVASLLIILLLSGVTFYTTIILILYTYLGVLSYPYLAGILFIGILILLTYYNRGKSTDLNSQSMEK